MHRRNFLKVASAGVATALSASVLPPLSARAADSDIVDVTLTSRPYRFSPGPNLEFSGLAFNGSIPGPLIRVRYGQRLRARYVNQSGSDSTIHWHGMILPNEMDGVPNVTQKPVPNGGTFFYDYKPNPPGFRWYHSHVTPQLTQGLFGPFIVEDPRDERADVEAVLVLHDVPIMKSYDEAVKGLSTARMIAPLGAPELAGMKMNMKGSAKSGGMGTMGGMSKMGGAKDPSMSAGAMSMGDGVAYMAYCVNGATYPRTKPIPVKVGQLVRLRILNASPTLTHYVGLGGHRLRVTHSDGNLLPHPVEVDMLRLGVAERYDAWFVVTRPGAWLLEAISDDPRSLGQSLVVHTPGMEHAKPERPPQTLHGVEYFTYQLAGNAGPERSPLVPGKIDVETNLLLGEGKKDTWKWTINGQTWPNTPKIHVRSNDRVLVRFHNPTNMEHPMHFHGHVFHLVEINGQSLRDPLPKDTTIVPANGGTAAWFFKATSPPGRWVLHCHNAVHLADGMMCEVDYATAAYFPL